MKMPLALFRPYRTQYNLDKHAVNGFVYLELLELSMDYHSGRTGQQTPPAPAPHGYYEVAHTPGLWRHVTRPISAILAKNQPKHPSYSPHTIKYVPTVCPQPKRPVLRANKMRRQYMGLY
eukprot:CCRYP_001202-RA/>CCRYP_001202-RA protein AED:0.67 eAED:0.67 QI:0/0/0/0.5/0/0/2/0/119